MDIKPILSRSWTTFNGRQVGRRESCDKSQHSKFVLEGNHEPRRPCPTIQRNQPLNRRTPHKWYGHTGHKKDRIRASHPHQKCRLKLSLTLVWNEVYFWIICSILKVPTRQLLKSISHSLCCLHIFLPILTTIWEQIDNRLAKY